MSADELVHLEVAGGVARVTLDSPLNRNALSRRLLADLDRQVRSAARDERARVIVLTGAGSVFCSGADLKEPRAAGAADRVGGPRRPGGHRHRALGVAEAGRRADQRADARRWASG